MKVRPTRTDSAGNGYYRGENGKYYYGNYKNGYLKETIEETNRRRVKEQKVRNNTPAAPSVPVQPAAASLGGGGLIGGITGIIGAIFTFIATVIYLGFMAVLAAICTVIGTVVGIVWIWGRLSKTVFQTFAEYGVTLETVLITLPIFLCIGIFLLLLILTLVKHKHYVWQLLVCYCIFFLPYPILTAGGLPALANHLVSISSIVTQTVSYAIGFGALPMIVLFLLYKLDAKVQQTKTKRQSEEAVNHDEDGLNQ